MQPLPLPAHLVLGTIPHNTQLTEVKKNKTKNRSPLVQGVQADQEGQVLLYLPPGHSQHFLSLPVARKKKPHVTVQSLHLLNFTCHNVDLERQSPRQGPSSGLLVTQKHHCSRATSCPGTRPI